MIRELFSFNGGVKPAYNKAPSNRQPIAEAPLSTELVIPLHQSIGGIPRPLVKAGEQVRKGQLIGGPDGNVSSAVHATTSGTVRALEMRRMPHTSGLSALCVILDPDGRDEWIDHAPIPWRTLSAGEVRDCPARCRRGRSGRRGFPVLPEDQSGQAGPSGHTGHQRCRMRALHHLRRHADARATRRHHQGRRHPARPDPGAPGADRHRRQQARGSGRDERRGRAAQGRGHRRSDGSCRRADPLSGRRCQAVDPGTHRHRGAAWQALHRLWRAVLQHRHRACGV